MKTDAAEFWASPLSENSIAFMGTPQPAVGESSVLHWLAQSSIVIEKTGVCSS
jgi:hypothetical protein